MSVKPVHRDFDSLAAFVEYASGPSDMANDNRSSRQPDAKRSDFHGSLSWGEAKTLAHGWKEGAEAIARMAARIRPTGQKNRRVAAMAATGPGAFSMGALNAGHPEPWVVLRETNAAKNGKGKIVRIRVTASFSGGIKTEAIERRGGAVVALVDALERAGRRCEVTVVVANAPSTATPVGQRSTYAVAVKKAHEKLNLPSLAFAIAHASMYRRFGFSAFEMESATWRSAHRIGAGYGSVVDAPKGDADIFLGSMMYGDSRWASEDAAEKWVIEEMKGQGVTLK